MFQLLKKVIPYRYKSIFIGMLYTIFHTKIRVKENIVLFESFHGRKIGENPYALFKGLLQHENYKGYKFIWVIEDIENEFANEIKEIPNVKFIRRNSLSYLRYLCEAKYLINNNTFPYYFIKKTNQVYVNTWHGTPLKSLGKEIKGTPGQHKNMARNFLMSDYFVHPNQFTVEKLLKTNDMETIYEGFIVDEGYPRIDLTLNTNKSETLERIRKLFQADIKNKIILYAPTWRGEIGKVLDTTKETIDIVKELYQHIPHDFTLLLKVHGLAYKYIKNDPELDEMLCIPDWFETNELLGVVDVLITDYSSIFFDYLNLGRPIIFYAYDREKYENERGFYLDLEDMPGPVCETINDVTKALENIEEISKLYEREIRKSREVFCYNDNGLATERVIDSVFHQNHSNNVYRVKDNGKLKILLYGGSLKNEKHYDGLTKMLNQIDYDRYDVTLLVDNKLRPGDQELVDGIHPKVKIIYRVGSFNYKLNELISMKWLFTWKKGTRNSIKKFVSGEFFKREYQRILGQTKFDIGINYAGDSIIWTAFIASNQFNQKYMYLDPKSVEKGDVELYNELCKFFDQLIVQEERYFVDDFSLDLINRFTCVDPLKSGYYSNVTHS